MLIVLFLVSHFNVLFVPCGGLSWLPVSFLLHVKYTLSYLIVSYRTYHLHVLYHIDAWNDAPRLPFSWSDFAVDELLNSVFKNLLDYLLLFIFVIVQTGKL